jgi:hypothetical protein
MLMRSPLARERRAPPGFIAPALLKPATKVPTGPGWIHELKHDGIGLIARKDGTRVQFWGATTGTGQRTSPRSSAACRSAASS